MLEYLRYLREHEPNYLVQARSGVWASPSRPARLPHERLNAHISRVDAIQQGLRDQLTAARNARARSAQPDSPSPPSVSQLLPDTATRAAALQAEDEAVVDAELAAYKAVAPSGNAEIYVAQHTHCVVSVTPIESPGLVRDLRERQ
jgi:hypothetical protein